MVLNSERINKIFERVINQSDKPKVNMEVQQTINVENSAQNLKLNKKLKSIIQKRKK